MLQALNGAGYRLVDKGSVSRFGATALPPSLKSANLRLHYRIAGRKEKSGERRVGRLLSSGASIS
jgi:hypothetical protein